MIATLILSLAALQSGAALPQGTPTQSSLGGTFVTPFAPSLQAGVLPGRMLEITMNLPGQLWQETFVIGIPQIVQYPAPVLTLFHGYGEEPRDVIANTPLVADAMARGWIVFIPLGAHKFNYGIEYAQRNIELSFQFLNTRLPIDLDRIYSVGFSMGGGAAASFAARHLDPNGIRFAALVNHTGTTSLRATYHTSNDTGLFESPLMFGASPAMNPFPYLQSSTIDLDPFTGLVDPAGEMASNLTHIPTRHWNANFDPNQTIIDQTVALHERMSMRGADTARSIVTSSIHSWGTLDSATVLDWLALQSLHTPVPGEVTKTVADRDGRWHDLEIVQAQSGALTPVMWSSQPVSNALYLIEMANIGSIGIDVTEVALDPMQSLIVILQTTDASTPDVVLEGFPSIPSDVKRRGISTSAWTHDAVAQTVTLHESGPMGWAAWTIIP